MAAKSLKNIFLSASIPLADRHPQYLETADIIAIRDSVIALTTTVLPHCRLIWGGHPSITPLINYVIQKLNLNVQDHVILYQSLWFEDKFIEDINEFENVVFTEKKENIPSSINLMREQMLGNYDFSAAVFIGGMEGIIDEYNMFKAKHPEAVILPIASTGAATKVLFDEYLNPEEKNERFLKDYGYMSLFQKYLLEKL